MDSQSIGNWIQLITSIAVLLGLGLVVWELQQNREATMSQLSSDHYQIAAQERAAVLGENAANALAKACFKPTELTDAELVVLDHFYNGMINRVHRMLALSRRGGFYSDDYWKDRMGNLDLLFVSKPGRAYWTSVASVWVDPELRAAGDRYLADWSFPTCEEEHSAWRRAIDELSAASSAGGIPESRQRRLIVTPNKAMKRTSLPVTSFACAKESPATVGRLSRR
jgi:hypothetical protein